MASQSDNPILSIIHERHSVRQFDSQSVPDEMITTILDAANKAPSAHNQQSWKFVVITGDKKTELSEIISASAPAFPRPSSALLRMASRSIISAPVIIAVINTGDLIRHGTDLFENGKEQATDFFRIMEIQSSAAAVQNLMLAASSLGLGTVWLGILFLIKDEVRKFLGEPEGEFMAVIPVGYPSRDSVGPKKAPLEKFVKYLN